jgi:hypothetical protein
MAVFGASRQIKVLNRCVFRDFAKQNHEKHIGLKRILPKAAKGVYTTASI